MAMMGRPLSSEWSAGGQEGNGEEKSRVTLSGGCKDPSHTQTLPSQTDVVPLCFSLLFFNPMWDFLYPVAHFYEKCAFSDVRVGDFFQIPLYTVDRAVVENQQPKKKSQTNIKR